MFVNFHNRESALVTDVSRQMFDDAEDDCCQCCRIAVIWSWSRVHQNLLHGPVVTIIDNLVERRRSGELFVVVVSTLVKHLPEDESLVPGHVVLHVCEVCCLVSSEGGVVRSVSRVDNDH